MTCAFFITCRTPKLLQRQVLPLDKNCKKFTCLEILKYFSPYLSFDMKNKICFFFWDKSWISEIHRSRSKNILRGGGPPPFKIFLVCSCFSRKQRHNWRISTFSFFSVTNMALNNYGRQHNWFWASYQTNNRSNRVRRPLWLRAKFFIVKLYVIRCESYGEDED